MKSPTFSKFRKSAGGHSDVQSRKTTIAPDLPWHSIGSAYDCLLPELEKLYWEGVEYELDSILMTLKTWQQPKYRSILLDDETDNFIHGYDTFIDQVRQESRAFATRYSKNNEQQDRTNRKAYRSTLLDRTLDVSAEQKITGLKVTIRSALADRWQPTVLERRAKMLLQSAAFLDIDKLIEHRPPHDNKSSWKRPAAPQLTLQQIDKNSVPIFAPLPCSSCNGIIRGNMFCNAGDKARDKLCEDCYRELHHGKGGLIKVYKHCILNDVIRPKSSRSICRCSTVSHFDAHGRSRTLFPVTGADKHRNVEGPGGARCGLLKLGEMVAEAKYAGMQNTIANPLKLSEETILDESDESKKASQKNDAVKATNRKPGRLRTLTERSVHDDKQRTPTSGSIFAAEKKADGDLPFLVKEHTGNYPFGNVHTALRIGPLIIENGVSNSKGGALIRIRDESNLQVPSRAKSQTKRSLALSGTSKKRLWWQEISGRKPKRFKAVMKQIAGAPFTGLLNENLERDIVKTLISASQKRLDDPGLAVSEQRTLRDQVLRGLVSKVKDLIGSKVKVYLESIASLLLAPDTNLRWRPTMDNCQNFCDMLISPELFGSLVPSTQPKAAPLYLMSFVCRPAGYVKRPVNTKFDVPSGLIEEYLLKLRDGRHDAADIVDTLQEYWHDWGAFGSHLYKHQDLFPWDCTEAYGRYPGTCNDCNIAKHVWAFPFDSWSIIFLHLAKDRFMYPPVDSTNPCILSDQDWMRNRLKVLLSLDVLISAAAAMAQNPTFRNSTSWLHEQDDPNLDRLKLGGIHRAQPFSHSFEQGTYHRYFIAEWAHLRREEQVAAYELLRDGRVKMVDVPHKGHPTVPSSTFNSNNYGGSRVHGHSPGAGFSSADFADAGFRFLAAPVSFSDVGDFSDGGCAGNCGSGSCGGGGDGGDGGGGGGCGGGGGGGGCGG